MVVPRRHVQKGRRLGSRCWGRRFGWARLVAAGYLLPRLGHRLGDPLQRPAELVELGARGRQGLRRVLHPILHRLGEEKHSGTEQSEYGQKDERSAHWRRDPDGPGHEPPAAKRGKHQCESHRNEQIPREVETGPRDDNGNDAEAASTRGPSIPLSCPGPGARRLQFRSSRRLA